MKRSAMRLLTFCTAALCLGWLPTAKSDVSAAGNSYNPLMSHAEDAGSYCYQFNIDLYNPCNSNDMDNDAINEFTFSFYYVKENGLGNTETLDLDFSWDGSKNRNADFLKTHFIRPNDNQQNDTFYIWLPGKLTEVQMHLNMDGGERLGFTVKEILCNRKKISLGTDYVSSAYSDSDGVISCAMEFSDCSAFLQKNDFLGDTFTAKEIENCVKGLDQNSFLRDQYNAILCQKYLNDFVASYDGEINQKFPHFDEPSFYKYTLLFVIDNPLDADAPADKIDELWFDFKYRAENGFANELKTYRLDCSWNSYESRNMNPEITQKFRGSDKTFAVDVWVPGVVEQIAMRLNVNFTWDFDELSLYLQDVSINQRSVLTAIPSIYSTVGESNDTAVLIAAPGQIDLTQMSETDASAYLNALRNGTAETPHDQHGGLVCDSVLNQCFKNPEKFFYRADLDPTLQKLLGIQKPFIYE